MSNTDFNVVVEDDANVDVELDEAGGVIAANTATETAAKAAAPAAKPATAADQAAADLTKALKLAETKRHAAEATATAERQRADDATRVAQQKEQEVLDARGEVAASNLATIISGIAAATTELDAAKKEFTRAFEAGEASAIADANARIAESGGDLARLKDAKINFEAEAARKPAARSEEAAAATTLSPFDRYVSGFPPQSQAWLRAHPDCVPDRVRMNNQNVNLGGNPIKNAMMMEGHYAALRQNIQPNTPEYFEVLEEHIGERTPMSAAADTRQAGAGSEDAGAAAAAAVRTQRKTPMPAATPSRDVPAADGQPRRVTVSLDKDQREAALFSYPQKQGEEETAWRKRAFGIYASEYVKAKAEGKIGRMTH